MQLGKLPHALYPHIIGLKGEGWKSVMKNRGPPCGSVAGTLRGWQPGVSWEANSFQEQFGNEFHKQPKQNITSLGPLCPKCSVQRELKGA